MKLSVGISQLKPEWKLILQQIGVSFKKVHFNRPIDPDQYAVLIINSPINGVNKENALQYLRKGGSLLTEADIAEQLLNIKTERAYIKYIYSDPDFIHSFTSPCDIYQKCIIASKAQYNEDQQGRHLSAVKEMGQGTVVILPSDLISSILDNKIQRKKFPSTNGARQPSERVSRVSKGGIRVLIHTALQYLFQVRNLPFLYLWYLPDGNPHQFSFRVDTDFSKKEDIESLYAVCRKFDIPATWFVEVKTQQDWIGFYREMQNQEIGYHCFRHRIFSQREKNRIDFTKGITRLRQENIYPEGYAAPYGEWNSSLGQVVKEFGFLYSSEFALAYDDLPFFPYLEEGFSPVVQIPIHPISAGSLRRARHTKKNMQDYYINILKIKQDLCLPIIFYHHPLHGCLDVIQRIFEKIREENIPAMCLKEYANWWRIRSEITWDPELNQGKLDLHSSCTDSSFWITASLPQGGEVLNPCTTNNTYLQEWKRLEKGEFTPNFDPESLRKFDWRMLVNNFEYYWGKLRQ